MKDKQVPPFHEEEFQLPHYTDVTMTTIASQITSLTVVYSNADQRKHQSSTSLAFVWGIHRDRWIPRTKGQLRGKCFHLMTSSCHAIFVLRNDWKWNYAIILSKINVIIVTVASDAELWCFLWSPPEQTVEQTIETPVILDAIALITTSL